VGRQEIIETETGMKSGLSIPALAVRGNGDGNGMHEMWSIPEESVSLRRQCLKSTQIESLKTADPPVDHAQTVAGTAGCEVAPFHQGNGKTPKRGVTCHRDPCNAAPHYDQVELLGRQRLKISLHLTSGV